MKSFPAKLAALPSAQQRLWPELQTIPQHFVLYGGTALALRLGHRQSIDFDFFSSEAFQPDELFRQLAFLAGATRLQSARNTLTVEVSRAGTVKLSFFGGLSLGRVGSPEMASPGDVLVASLLDLAGTKMAVIQERAMSKDYLDIAALLNAGLDASSMLGAAQALYENFNPLISLKAMSYFRDGDLPNLPKAIQDQLSAAASATRETARIDRVSDHIGC